MRFREVLEYYIYINKYCNWFILFFVILGVFKTFQNSIL